MSLHFNSWWKIAVAFIAFLNYGISKNRECNSFRIKRFRSACERLIDIDSGIT